MLGISTVVSHFSAIQTPARLRCIETASADALATAAAAAACHYLVVTTTTTRSSKC
jgi:hypothetical protein